MKTSLLIVAFLSGFCVNAQKLEFKVFYDKDSLLVTYKGDIANGKANGQGEAYDASDKKRKIYEGTWKDNQFDGKGKIWNYKTLVYDGDLKSGKPDGFGKWIYNDKNKPEYYEGHWKNGKKNGKGFLQYQRIYTNLAGFYYDGDWLDDEKHGKGKEDIEMKVYTGDWVHNKRSGKGKFEWLQNNESYDGDWKDSVRDGFGIYVFSSGTIYEGSFINNQQSGKGKYIYKDGSSFEGNFLKDKREGFGIMKFANGEIHEGNWINDQRTGKGKYTWNTGDYYEGEFLENKITGKGKSVTVSGNIYEGDWLDDQRNGKGVLTFKNGDVYTGDFSIGKYHGIGTLKYADGKVESGYWKYGNFVRTANPTGTIKYKNGEYSGEMVDGFPQRKGKMVFTDGRIYSGDFDNKTINGYGQMKTPNGFVFQGQWVNGHITNGQRTDEKGNVYYGNFLDDKFQDEKGVYVWTSGGKLEASFANGKQVKGEGKYTKASGCIVTGIFEDYKPVENIKYSSNCSLNLQSDNEDY